MTYMKFKSTYRWMIKHFPGTDNVWGYKGIEAITTHFEKRGSRWHEVSAKTETVDSTFYANCVDAIPFFRNLDGKEMVTMGYTKIGYIPTEINSLSPDRTEKTVRRFYFNNTEREV